MGNTLNLTGHVVPEEKYPKIRAGFIGCGSHAFRNVFPALQFANVKLVATCDLVKEKAELFAKQFGADRSYDNYHEMLERENLDAVFVVVGYDSAGKPLYPPIAKDCMRAGCNVWIEKPPASSVEEILEMMKVEEETGKFVLVGFKKCFFPAIEKAKAIIEGKGFGKLNTLYVRYPQCLPDRTGVRGPLTHNPSLIGLLDHIVHPGSIISYLGGKMKSVFYQSSSVRGGFINIEFENGAIGVIHMAAGISGHSPLERMEAIGEGANVIVDNGIRLIYYKRGHRGPYGATPSFIGDDSEAPIIWEPEFSLGQLYNKNLFTLGYYGEVQYFAELCLAGKKPEKAGLEMALEQLKLYEAILKAEGEIIML